MKNSLGIFAAIIFLTAAGCSTSHPARSADSDSGAVTPEVEPGRPQQPPIAAVPAINSQTPGNPAPAIQAPPVNAQWTIYCDTFRGDGHVELADRAKEELALTTHLNHWYLIHRADESQLYYGYYDSINSPRAQADKRQIDGVATAAGTRRFAASMFVPLSSPDPEAPPQWNLANTPPNMFFSLQIAAFKTTPDRKQRAVEAVREARAMGIEAYYYHGDSISSVCIGAWPKTAVRQQGQDNVAHTDSPDTAMIVVNDVVPPGFLDNAHDPEGHPVQVFAPKLEIIDPTLKAAIAKYPEHAVNGYVYEHQDASGKPIPTPSFLVQIPHRDNLLNGGDDNGDASGTAAAPGDQPTGTTPDGEDTSLGKLRTIGEH